MTERPPVGPNAAQIEHWNAQAGDTWAALHDRLDAQLEPLGRAAMDSAPPASGERVLDIGCGTGQTTLALGERVGSQGSALGVDISRPMLELARARARAAAIKNVRFEQADAQIYALEPRAFDYAFSRFGVMFFADPVAAFANLRAAMRQGGRLVFVTWRSARENQWVSVPCEAAYRHLPRPAPPEPGAPGEFSLADADRLRPILAGAGFAKIAIDPHDMPIGGGSLERMLDTILRMGPVEAALRESGQDQREAVAISLREALTPFAGVQGVRMGSATWLVRAVNP
jgi:SAM-dependent methyltransferase